MAKVKKKNKAKGENFKKDTEQKIPRQVKELITELFSAAEEADYHLILVPKAKDEDSSREANIIATGFFWSLMRISRDGIEKDFLRDFYAEALDCYVSGIIAGHLTAVPHSFKHLNIVLKAILNNTQRYEENPLETMNDLLARHKESCKNPDCKGEEALQKAITMLEVSGASDKSNSVEAGFVN